MFVHSPNKKSPVRSMKTFFHKGFVAMGPTSKIVGLVPFG